MVSTVTIATVSHSKNLVILPTAYFPMIRSLPAISAIKIRSTGKIKPPINCDCNIMSIKPISGKSTITSERAIIIVSKVLKVGASFHLKSTPASHPKASQTTNEVVSGSTHAAKNEAATSPTPNKISA